MKIRGAPTTLAYYDGQEVGRVVGSASLAEIEVLFASATGDTTQRPTRVSAEDRKFRTGAGIALLVAGLLVQNVWLLVLGAALVLSGWYDLVVPNGSGHDQ